MCLGIPNEARSTELTLGPGGVVDAAEAVAGVGVTELVGPMRVCIPTAVTWNTNPGRFVEAGGALVTLWAAVPGKALVTHWGATGICTGTEQDRCTLAPDQFDFRQTVLRFHLMQRHIRKCFLLFFVLFAILQKVL